MDKIEKVPEAIKATEVLNYGMSVFVASAHWLIKITALSLS